MSARFVEVLIPLATARAEACSDVCHVRAESDPHGLSESGGFHPTIAALRAMGLHKAGQRALDRVNILPSRRAGSLKLPRLLPARQRSSRLKPLNVEAVRSLGPDNARSAELGLALAILTLERHRNARLIIATGALADKANGATSALYTPVLPVAGLSQKFQAIGDWLENHRPLPGGANLDILVPLQTLSGAEVTTEHASDISVLQKRLATIGYKAAIRPVGSLAQAAEILGAADAPVDLKEYLARATLALCLCVVALLLASLTPLRPQATTLDFFIDGPLQTPVVQRRIKGQQMPVAHCRDADAVLKLREHDVLTVRYTTDATWWPAWSYQVMFVVIGQTSAAKVFTGDALHPDDVPKKNSKNAIEFGFAIDVGDVQEDMILVTLGRKIFPFKTASVFSVLGQAQHLAVVEPATQSNANNALNAQAAALQEIYGSFTWHNFRVVGESQAC